jgi:hypothetical protein
MEVYFTYKVTGHDSWDRLEEACNRAARLNKNFTNFAVLPPGEGEDYGLVLLCSAGHDQSAIRRRIIAPIRSIFHRAGIEGARISLIEQRVAPNGRHRTVAEGRAPKGTFMADSLGDMLADAARDEAAVSGD